MLSNLSDANYAFFGPLTVYYGSIMGIDASDQNTLRWSNVGDATTGYGTGTSDQSWSLQQTSADPLTCVIGTNQALFAFRSNSIAIITGASNSDFASSGAVDAVQSIGTNSPDSVMLAGQSVVFLDQYLRPGRVQIGYGYIPLYLRIQETLRGIGNTPVLETSAWGRLDPTTNLIKFAFRWTTGASTNTQMLVYDVNSFECFGVHQVVNSAGYNPIDHAYSGGNPQSSSPMLDQNGQPIHVVASGTTADCAFYWQSHEFVHGDREPRRAGQWHHGDRARDGANAVDGRRSDYRESVGSGGGRDSECGREYDGLPDRDERISHPVHELDDAERHDLLGDGECDLGQLRRPDHEGGDFVAAAATLPIHSVQLYE